MLSASANKLSTLKGRAHEYADLIMEELDPENLGYIEVITTPLCHFHFYFLAKVSLLSYFTIDFSLGKKLSHTIIIRDITN